jgi:hypothetical protein
MEGEPAVLVTPASAKHCPPWGDKEANTCPVDRTHSEMVKFQHEEPHYMDALQHIEHFVQQALKGLSAESM